MLGPLWITISTGAMVGMLSVLYGALFQQPLRVYAPFVGIGMVVWVYLSSLANDATTVFQSAEGIIKQVRMPLTVHVCRMVWRNLIVFFHNAIILLPILLIFGKGLSVDMLLVPFGILAIAVNGIWIGLVIGVLCARFRDIPQLVTSVVQIVFFVTPIMWLPEILAARGVPWVANMNPIYHFIEIVRAPLSGAGTPVMSWLAIVAVTVLGWMLALAVLSRFRHRVPYWL
jgi:lipopolysaccharide transport system permease protein